MCMLCHTALFSKLEDQRKTRRTRKIYYLPKHKFYKSLLFVFSNATAPSSPVTTKPMSSFFKQRHEAKVEAEKTKSLKPKEEKKQEELNNNMIIVRDDVPELRTGQEKSEVDEEEDLEQEHSDYYSSIFLDDLNEEDGKIYGTFIVFLPLFLYLEDFRQYISSSKLKESQFSFSGDTLTEPPKGPSSVSEETYLLVLLFDDKNTYCKLAVMFD